jgi:hypothetical protein
VDIRIQISMPDQAPAPGSTKSIPLRQRVKYAVECIECEAPNKHQAVEYLTKLYAKLDKLAHTSEEMLALKEEIEPVVHEYGYYPEAGDADGE